ncbi:hypothetical protein EUA06_03060 [Nocardioides glacieisoli]|uniref:DUF2637 domain-containing protein n=1 Tax=Nocardioides glacieisoli TaxID=1168730 RepID=A0A4Q2S483_9ACTN|nr:hypothetical protein [Nocardioides glacieisoli]RYB96561.1 hypothetical protein EUA06_03060 [Nocardioides glacieisoli]
MTGKQTKVPNLREWADTVSARAFDPAWIDLYTLQQYDPVLSALGWRSTFRTSARTEDRLRTMDRHVAAIFFFLFLLPVIAVTGTLGGSDLATHTEFAGLDAGVGVPLVAIVFTLSLPGPLLELRRCVLHRGRVTYIEIAGFCVTLFASAATLAGMSSNWDVDVLRLALPSVPVWASLVLTATTLGAITVATSRQGPAAPDHFRRSGDPDLVRARELLARLAPGERDHLAQARGRAISTLRDRGLLTLEQAVQLSDLALGESMSLLDTRRKAS